MSVRRLLPASVRRTIRGCVDALPARLAWKRMLREARPDPGAPAIDHGHVCLLAWYFPPMVTGGTYRPASLVKHGTDAGLRFTVIAAPLHEDPSEAGRYLVGQLPSTARVVRAPPPDLEPLPIAVPGLDGGAMNALEVWRLARRTFVDRRPEFVFATGPPFHTFVAAHLLAARFGVPLVLEYRDEWTECPFDFVQAGPDDRVWEARCLAAAWRVIFTTGSQLDRHVAVFPELDRARCVVIPNGWEADDAPPDSDDPPDSSDATSTLPVGRRTIAFTGNLGDHTLPGGFLDCLASAVARRPDLAERFTFRFVGRRSRRAADQLDESGVGRMIELTDQVPKLEVTRIVREVDGLLLLNPPALRRYLPGKLYEYLAAGRPILVYGEGGEAGALVERLNAGRVVAAADAPALIEALEWMDAQPPGPVISPGRADWLARHTREALARRTIALLESARGDAAGTESGPAAR